MAELGQNIGRNLDERTEKADKAVARKVRRMGRAGRPLWSSEKKRAGDDGKLDADRVESRLGRWRWKVQARWSGREARKAVRSEAVALLAGAAVEKYSKGGLEGLARETREAREEKIRERRDRWKAKADVAKWRLDRWAKAKWSSRRLERMAKVQEAKIAGLLRDAAKEVRLKGDGNSMGQQLVESRQKAVEAVEKLATAVPGGQTEGKKRVEKELKKARRGKAVAELRWSAKNGNSSDSLRSDARAAVEAMALGELQRNLDREKRAREASGFFSGRAARAAEAFRWAGRGFRGVQEARNVKVDELLGEAKKRLWGDSFSSRLAERAKESAVGRLVRRGIGRPETEKDEKDRKDRQKAAELLKKAGGSTPSSWGERLKRLGYKSGSFALIGIVLALLAVLGPANFVRKRLEDAAKGA